MRGRIQAYGVSLIGIALAGWITLTYPPAEAQNVDGTYTAVSNTVNEHVHSLSLSKKHVTDLLAVLSEDGAINLQSSQEYDGNVNENVIHSHTVSLDRLQLGVLQATGTLDVESEESAGHTHIFRFLTEKECSAVTQPLIYSYPQFCCPYRGKCSYPYPYPTTCAAPGACPAPCFTCVHPFPLPTPCQTCPMYPFPTPTPCRNCTPYPAPLPTSLPSPSPSVTPSTSPSPSPSVSVSPSPIITPSPSSFISPSPASTLLPTPSASPTPRPTITLSPSPGVTFSPSPSIMRTPSPRVTPNEEATPNNTPSPFPGREENSENFL